MVHDYVFALIRVLKGIWEVKEQKIEKRAGGKVFWGKWINVFAHLCAS